MKLRVKGIRTGLGAAGRVGGMAEKCPVIPSCAQRALGGIPHTCGTSLKKWGGESSKHCLPGVVEKMVGTPEGAVTAREPGEKSILRFGSKP